MSGPGVAARLLGNARFEIVPSGGVETELRHLPPGTTVTVTCSPRKGIDRQRLPGFREVLVHGYVALDLARVVEALDELEPTERFGAIVADIEAEG